MKHRDEESSASDSLRGNSRLEEVIRPTTTRYIVLACFLSFFLSPRGDFFLLFRGDARSIKLLARIFQQEIYRAQSHSNAANTRRRSQALNASTPISPTIMPVGFFASFTETSRENKPCSNQPFSKELVRTLPRFFGKTDKNRLLLSFLDPCSISTLEFAAISNIGK